MSDNRSLDIGRRALLGAAVAAAGVPVVARAGGAGRRADFRVAPGQVLLNNAGTHPLYAPAADAVQRYLGYKQSGVFPDDFPLFGIVERPRASFAKLINASPDEIAVTQSTSMGENLVVNGLGLPGGRGNIVTDALHHEGSLYMYGAIASRDLEIRVARPRDWRITLADLDKLIDRDTKLVAISFVSWINGFEHDLKAICDLAHSRGALVYVDMIQGLGMVPIDVKAAGVDFAAAATYKWLMGDCGVAFLYVRAELQERVKRSQWGFMQFSDMTYHAFPGDTPSEKVADFEPWQGARGRYEVGTPSFAAIAAADKALAFVSECGVETINAHVRPLVARLQDALPRHGYVPMTPRESRSSIASFLVSDRAAVRERLSKAGIQARLWGQQLRISPAIHNTSDDIEQIIEVLASAAKAR
ncbi:aminotransferase class V-fold PLP-dependent enzyme [Sphingopyxis panaciterrae]